MSFATSAIKPGTLLRRLSSLTVLLVLTACAATLHAQAPPTKGHTWESVKVLKVDTPIRINTTKGDHVRCNFASATDDTLTCGTAVFQKSNISSIKNSRRSRSTAVGLGIGVGAAVAITAATAASSNNLSLIIPLAIIDLALIVITPVIGYITDFTAGTIYKAVP